MSTNPMARNKNTPKAGKRSTRKTEDRPSDASKESSQIERLVSAGNAMAIMLTDTARPSTEDRICAIADWQMAAADALK